MRLGSVCAPSDTEQTPNPAVLRESTVSAVPGHCRRVRRSAELRASDDRRAAGRRDRRHLLRGGRPALPLRRLAQPPRLRHRLRARRLVLLAHHRLHHPHGRVAGERRWGGGGESEVGRGAHWC